MRAPVPQPHGSAHFCPPQDTVHNVTFKQYIMKCRASEDKRDMSRGVQVVVMAQQPMDFANDSRELLKTLLQA